MTLWSDIFNHRHLLSRKYYNVPGSVGIVAPAKAAYIRASAVGAGSALAAGGFGHGAAFARVKTTCAPSDAFTLQIGDHAHAVDAGSSAGDTTLTKVSGGTVLLKAARATGTAPGNASNCIGDTKRTGGSALAYAAGSSAGDDADPYPLGFGERGAGGTAADGTMLFGAGPGGGGALGHLLLDYVYDDGSGGFITYTYPVDFVAADGLICVEFFDQDPAIIITGY